MPTVTAVPVVLRAPSPPPEWPPDVLAGLLSCDTKTTGAASMTAAGARARSANATWHPAIESCPGSSSVCRGDCYAWRLERCRPSVRDAAARRLALWDDAIRAGDGADLAAALIRHVRADAVRRGILPTFRIHASGDFHSAGYVDAWRDGGRMVAADDGPPVRVWTYSRSYGSAGRDLLARLLDGDGFPPAGWSVYLSADAGMVDRARNAVAGIYHRLPVAVMADDAAHGADLLRRIRATDARPDAGIGVTRRALTCPVVPGGMPIVTERRGRLVGACHHCRACLPANAATAPDIVFPIH